MRRAVTKDAWVFPAPTRSGHIEKSSLKRQHPKEYKLAKLPEFPLYTFRHTCRTRWAASIDPYTLGYLAGHSDFSTTRRYVHPQAHTIMEAIERARNAQGGHNSGHKTEKAAETPSGPAAVSNNDFRNLSGRGEWIRTTDLLVSNLIRAYHGNT
jgi:hypothetical protein